MLRFILRRLLLLILMCLAVSLIGFAILHLSAGDYVSTYIRELQARGQLADQASLAQFEQQVGLGQPLPRQYLLWLRGILRGQFGQSLQWGLPVKQLIWDRLGLTALLAFTALLLIGAIALPVGIWAALKRRAVGDVIATLVSVVGVAIPDFLLALAIMWLVWSQLGVRIEGLFSLEFIGVPWSWATVLDLLRHIWLPVAVLVMGGVGGLIRVMRANLLAELRQPYVAAARAQGWPERRLLARYPVRVALAPFVGAAGWMLPGLVSGATILAVVMNLPTTGPLLLNALRSQDLYLASTVLMMLCLLTIVGTLLSDILLAWLDPRIRCE